MSTELEMVRAFHAKAGARLDEPVTPELVRERWALVAEEFIEFAAEWLGLVPKHEQLLRSMLSAVGRHATDRAAANGSAVAKEAADLKYVVTGACANVGIDADHAFELVHANNMAKLDAEGLTRDWNGKVVKPAGWVGPDLSSCVPSAVQP